MLEGGEAVEADDRLGGREESHLIEIGKFFNGRLRLTSSFSKICKEMTSLSSNLKTILESHTDFSDGNHHRIS